MSMTFGTVCGFCGDPVREISSSGIGVCQSCDLAICIVGPQPASASADQYRNVILEVAAIARLLPQAPGEKWADYKLRITIAVEVRRKGQPLPAHLDRPLSEAALRACREGRPISAVLAAAAKPAPKPIEVRKPRADVEPVRRRKLL